MKTTRATLFFLLGWLVSLPALAQVPLRVAAAADLEPVLPPILAAFQQATGIHTEATYQSSAALTTQIENGAPFDVFLSADLSYPQRLIGEHLAEGSAPTTYAKGTLVLWERKGAGLPPPSLDLLRNPALKRLAIADPNRAPYGKAAVAALHSLGLYDALLPKVVTATNIAQAAQFADTGNADAGLISLTSASTPHMASNGTYFVMPRSSYPAIEQGVVVLSKSAQSAEAQKFAAYMLSATVQAQLAKSGLAPAK